MRYGSGKCVSGTFCASLGTATCINALDVEVNSRLWLCPQTREKEMSPVMLLLADPAQSYRLECNGRIYNRDPALFCLCNLEF